MLADLFESPLRIQELHNGPAGPSPEGFANELCRVGYAEITARRHIGRHSALAASSVPAVPRL